MTNDEAKWGPERIEAAFNLNAQNALASNLNGGQV